MKKSCSMSTWVTLFSLLSLSVSAPRAPSAIRHKNIVKEKESWNHILTFCLKQKQISAFFLADFFGVVMKSYFKCRECVRERKCKKAFLFFFGGCSVLFMDVRSSSMTEIKLRCSQEPFKIPLLCHLRVSQLYLSDYLKVIRTYSIEWKVRKCKMINFHPNRHNCTCLVHTCILKCLPKCSCSSGGRAGLWFDP